MFFPTLSGLTLDEMKIHSQTQRSIKDSSTTHAQSYRGEGVEVDANGHKLAVFYSNNRLYCTEEKCPHAGGPLHLGDIEDSYHKGVPCVTCPWHRFCFELDSGHIIHPPSRTELKLQTYPIRVNRHGLVSVGFKSFSLSVFKDKEF